MDAIEQYTDLEIEVVGLSIVTRTIDSIVNREVLELLDSSDSTEVRFPTAIHQKLFYIIVADFLSERSDPALTREKISCVGLLDKVCSRPLLEVEQSATDLKAAQQLFKDWLSREVVRDIWMPSLNKTEEL